MEILQLIVECQCKEWRWYQLVVTIATSVGQSQNEYQINHPMNVPTNSENLAKIGPVNSEKFGRKCKFWCIIPKAKICHFVIYVTTGLKLNKFLHDVWGIISAIKLLIHNVIFWFALQCQCNKWRSLGNFTPKFVVTATDLKGSKKEQIYNAWSNTYHSVKNHENQLWDNWSPRIFEIIFKKISQAKHIAVSAGMTSGLITKPKPGVQS